jgi:lipoprotein-anchoring transpeptidase ErfK/SrfK
MKTNSVIALVCGLSMMTGVIGCGTGKEPEQKKEAPETVAPHEDSITKTNNTTTKEEPPRDQQDIRYSAFPLKGVDSAVKVFKKKYTKEQQWIVLALNRLDAGNIWRADTLILPDTVLPDLSYYSPFPQEMPMLGEVNKIVIFSYAIQAFAAYEKGKQVYWGPTSMGSKIHPTPTGLHFANWKAKQTISTVNDEWKLKWNFNIENKEGVGWHQYAMPGYPASHSCLRMLEEQAQWMYTWAEQWILESNTSVAAQGTPVIVFGAYPFGSRRPWRNQLEDPKATHLTKEALEEEVKPHLQRIMEQQQRRESVLAGKQQDTAKAPANPS